MAARRLRAAALAALCVLALAGAEAAAGADDVRLPGGIGIAVYLEPASALFGDPMRANVELLIDPKLVDPGSVRLTTTGFAPYSPMAPPTRTRRDRRGVIILRTSYRLLCLRPACRPPVGRVRTFRFPPARVTFRRRNGREGRFSAAWYPFSVASRLSQDTALRADWQARANPPPPVTYAVDPSSVSTLLYALAGIVALVGWVLVWFAAAPIVRRELVRRRVARLGRIQRELALLRDAVTRGETEAQRRALDSLAVVLAENGTHDLVRHARRLAWSETGPGSEDVLAFAAAVERRLAGATA